MTSKDWDPKLTEWGVLPIEKRNSKWQLVAGRVLDPVAMGHAAVIRISVLDAAGKLKPGVKCCSDWENRSPGDAPPNPKPTDEHPGSNFGTCEFPLTGWLNPVTSQRGPHWVYVEEARPKSDEVQKLGRLNSDTSIGLTFKMRGAPPPKKAISTRSQKKIMPKRRVKKTKSKRIAKK